MVQSNCPSLSRIVMNKLTLHCGLGLDCHGVGGVLMNTHSILLGFLSKPSFVMHEGIVIRNAKFANL